METDLQHKAYAFKDIGPTTMYFAWKNYCLRIAAGHSTLEEGLNMVLIEASPHPREGVEE